ncbi:unnamed protein product [Larinioides sclopetarius]|uniref:LRRCT domain-containing protein n=1 Tax=Larinioides sclopetarius TaxID=280406 RepID=A0AAV2BZ71_9ARAC
MGKAYILATIFLIALIPACLSAPEDICPSEDLVKPCICQKDFQSDRAVVRCEKITGYDVVMEVLNKTSEYGYEYFIIDLSSLTYIPAVAFEIKRLARLIILESTMVSLFNEPPKTKDLEQLTLYKLKLSRKIQWDLFTEIPNLKNLSIEHSPLKSVDSSFVQNAPKSLERITITNCSINKVEDKAFESMPNLIELIMDQGKIKEVKRSMFPSPANYLQKISFKNQRIESLPDDMFKDMPRLQDIWLTGNLISQVSENTFKAPFEIIRSCTLDNNPIKCNCSLRWLTRMDLSRTLRRNLLGECEEPKNLHGALLNELTPNDFQHCDQRT